MSDYVGARALCDSLPNVDWLLGDRGCDVGLPVILMETRQVKGALKAMPVKTDRRDAEGIARLLHLGWFRPVHCNSVRTVASNVEHAYEMDTPELYRTSALSAAFQADHGPKHVPERP